MKILRHLVAGIVLAAALTGSAVAAPPSTPPGQEKQAEQADPATAADRGASQNENTPPGQEKKGEHATLEADAQSSSGIASTAEGVKPSSDTEKRTWTTAGAKPDKSKRYGNGTTAAQIATSRGAPASTPVYGPGNSQPHKVCGKNGHYVDVHAVKTYAGTTCAATTTTTATTTSSPTVATTVVTAGSTVTVTPSTSPTTSATTGVAGTERTSVAGTEASRAAGVAGALDAMGTAAGGTLPFTGFPLWVVALAGIAAIALGRALLWRSRPATRSTA